MKLVTYSFRIVAEDGDEPNPVHLCEEIQAYLNSNLSYYDEDESRVNAEVIGYNVTQDNYVTYHAQEEY
tara:strand:- start:40 stop:246 length:207 start_codon:yes stop_codon:yes gene_type:complete